MVVKYDKRSNMTTTFGIFLVPYCPKTCHKKHENFPEGLELCVQLAS